MSLLAVLFYACLQVAMFVQSWDFCLMAFLEHDLTTYIEDTGTLYCIYFM